MFKLYAEFIISQKQLILDELNIKTISIMSSLKDMGSFIVKPNFKILSSKFEEDMQSVVKYIGTLDQYDVMDKYLSNEQISSDKFDIIKEDVIVQIKGHEKEEACSSSNVYDEFGLSVLDISDDLIEQYDIQRPMNSDIQGVVVVDIEEGGYRSYFWKANAL